MLSRYEKFIWLTVGFNYHKLNYGRISTIAQQLFQLNIQAGLYKINNIFLQHSFLLSALTGQPSLINFQTHGKKRKKTLNFSAILLKTYYLFFLDKFLHELLPSFVDFKFFKFHKNKYCNKYNAYSLRFRYRIGFFPEFDNLIETSFYNSYRSIYLPLTIHFIFNTFEPLCFHELFIRMLRMPIFWYKRNYNEIYL